MEFQGLELTVATLIYVVHRHGTYGKLSSTLYVLKKTTNAPIIHSIY
jgi:hypothetical protein